MTVESTFAFALAMLVFAATPGPGVFASVAQSRSSGFRSPINVIAGIVVGDLLLILMMVVFLPIAFLPCNPPVNAGDEKTILEVWDTIKAPPPVALKATKIEPALSFDFRRDGGLGRGKM